MSLVRKSVESPVSVSTRFVGFLQCSRQKEQTEEAVGMETETFIHIKMNTKKLWLKELQDGTRYEATP